MMLQDFFLGLLCCGSSIGRWSFPFGIYKFPFLGTLESWAILCAISSCSNIAKLWWPCRAWCSPAWWWVPYSHLDFCLSCTCCWQAKCWQNVEKSKILKKLHCFVTFCPIQTLNLPIRHVFGEDPRTDPSSQREKFSILPTNLSEILFGSFL